jgi:hypothetical protein
METQMDDLFELKQCLPTWAYAKVILSLDLLNDQDTTYMINLHSCTDADGYLALSHGVQQVSLPILYKIFCCVYALEKFGQSTNVWVAPHHKRAVLSDILNKFLFDPSPGKMLYYFETDLVLELISEITVFIESLSEDDDEIDRILEGVECAKYFEAFYQYTLENP